MAITDINVNLKARNNSNEVAFRLLPKTLANNVTESVEKQFVSADQKNKWDNKQDKIGAVSAEFINSMFK